MPDCSAGWAASSAGGRAKISAAGVDRGEVEDVAEEGADGLGVLGEDEGVDPGDHSLAAPRRRRKPAMRMTMTVPMMAEMMPPKSNTSVSPMPRPTVKIR